MLLTILKYQLRSGFFFTLVFTFFVSLAEAYFLKSISPLVFIFHQKLFYSIYSNLFISIIHILISDIHVSRVLLLQNLSILFWLNFWYLLGKLIAPFFLGLSLSTDFFYFLTFNACAMVSFIIGNYISNSDVVTYKNRLIRSIISGAIYSFIISFFALTAVLLSASHNKITYMAILLLFIVVFWYWCLRSYENLTYFKFLNRDND